MIFLALGEYADDHALPATEASIHACQNISDHVFEIARCM